MLSIRNLRARTGDKEILKGLDLTVAAGEVHAVMGPNGSGKSTLAGVLAGHPAFEVTGGEILFDGKNLVELSPEDRARSGVFLAFQYPVEIPGVKNNYFLRTAVNAVRTHRGEPVLDAMDFLALSKKKMAEVEMPPDLMNRSINEGFSGGEKKRNEVLQMLLLEPRLCIPRRDGFRSRYRRAAGRGRRREQPALAGSSHARDHPLPAAARLHRAGSRARIVRGANRSLGRQRPGP